MAKTIRHFTIRAPEEIYDLSLKLAECFPLPDQVITGIYELLMNAIEHGNLSIGFDVKTVLLRYGKLAEEIKRRLMLPENTHKHVDVTLEENDGDCRLVITDMGAGFNWKERIEQCGRYKHISPHGRGLLITINSGFDGLNFNEAGNSVTIISKRIHLVTTSEMHKDNALVSASEGYQHTGNE